MVDLSHSSRLLLSLLICSASIGLCDTAAINRTCGTKTPSDAVLKQDRLVRQNLRKQLKKKHPLYEGEYSRTRRDVIPLDEEPQILIPVKFICFANSNGWGEFSRAQAMRQIKRLNEGFNGTDGKESKRPHAVDTRISFKFESLEVVEDNLYFNQAEENEGRMKREYALHTDRYIYIFTADLGESLLGWADFPNTNPEGHYLWSVVLNFRTIPGFNFCGGGYDNGGTLVHEMGHMLGLYHTFQGGCSSINDEVSDTPACETSYGCPSVSDTCPSFSGADQTENFMSYSDDSCMNTFTMGQALRIRESLKAYRPSSLHFWSRDAAGDAFTYSPTTVPPPTPPVMQLSQIIAAAPTLECNSIVEVADIRVSGYDLLGNLSPEMLYKFTLEQRQVVQIRSCGSSYDTVLMIYQPDVPLAHSSNDDHDLCGADSLQSVIEVVLDPGDYYAVVEAYSLTSLNTSGYTKLELRCSQLTTLAPTPPPPSFTETLSQAPQLTCNEQITGTTGDGFHYLGHQSNEVYFKVVVTKSMRVIVKSCGSSFDTVLSLFNTTGFTPLSIAVTCNDDHDDGGRCPDASDILHSVIDVVLDPGDYYVVIEGYGTQSTDGEFKLTYKCPDVVMESTDSTVPPVTTVTTTTVTTAVDDDFNLPWNDDPDHITTRDEWCALELNEGCYACENMELAGLYCVDQCVEFGCERPESGTESTMATPPGRTARETTTTSEELVTTIASTTPFVPQSVEEAVAMAPNLTCGESVSGNTNSGSSFVGHPSNEHFYRLNLDTPMRVILHTCDDATDFDTYLHIFSSAQVLTSTLGTYYNDDAKGATAECQMVKPGSSRLEVYLDAGVWYVVIEGYWQNTGEYRLHVGCQMSSTPTLAPTTPAPTPSAANIIASARRIECGQTVENSTRILGTNVGGQNSREHFYRVFVSAPTNVTVHTCGSTFATVLSVFDATTFTTAMNNAKFRDDDQQGECALHTGTVGSRMQSFLGNMTLTPGVWLIVIEGYNQENDGNYSLSIDCRSLGPPQQPLEQRCDATQGCENGHCPQFKHGKRYIRQCNGD